MTHLKQRQLWVDFLSVSVVWEVCSGWFDREEEEEEEGQSISRGSIAQAPSSLQGGSSGQTPTAFRDCILNCWS